MILDPKKSYARLNNIIYENGMPIIWLKQIFIDVEVMKDNVINYTNKYLEANPDLYSLKPMNKIIKMFYDLETTGLEVGKHGIHHISGMIEVDNEVKEKFDFKVRPFPKAIINEEALKVGGVTSEQIMSYEPMEKVYKKILMMLSKYVDRFNKQEKIFLVGFNNARFDDEHLRKWFEQNGDTFFGSWFWGESLDVRVLAGQYLQERRSSIPSFKLPRVAIEVGIEVDENRLHDAEYDIYLTREIYRIVTGLEIEL